METVSSLVSEKAVVIFSRSSCSMSHAIKSLILNFGANPTVYEVDEMANGRQIEAELREMGCEPSVPAVFIGQRFIGGAKQVMTLQLSNQLVPLLRAARAIWI